MRNKLVLLMLSILSTSCSDGIQDISQCVDNLPCREDAGAIVDVRSVRDTGCGFQCGTDNNCIDCFGLVDYVNHYSNTNEYENMFIWDTNGRLIGNRIRVMVQARITKRRGQPISSNGDNIYSAQVNVYGYENRNDNRLFGDFSEEIVRTRFRFIQTQQNSLRFICDCMNGARTCVDCSNQNTCSLSSGLNTTTDRDRNNYCTLNTESRLVYTINGNESSLSNSFFFQRNNYHVLIFFNPVAR